jgi:ABC-type glutathione transport system ATPase component
VQAVEPAGALAPVTGQRRPGGHCVLRIRGLVKNFHRGLPPRRRTIQVLKGADLEVCSGELVGPVGENGSGRAP